MNTSSAKPQHDYFGIGLGLFSWIFPEVPVWVKVIVTIVVIGLILFLRMDKERQKKTLDAAGDLSEKTISNFIAPAIGGAFRGLFISLIAIILADLILNIHLIHHEAFTPYGSGTSDSTASFFLKSLSNLTGTGSTLLTIGIIIGVVVKLEEKKNQTASLLRSQMKNKRYSVAEYRGASQFLWTKTHNFDFSYNGRTYHHKEYTYKKNIDPAKKKYIIEFSADRPDIAGILWDNRVPETATVPPPGGWEIVPA